jgi:hypothetical protein
VGSPIVSRCDLVDSMSVRYTARRRKQFSLATRQTLIKPQYVPRRMSQGRTMRAKKRHRHIPPRAAVPSVVIPFAGDQFFWAERIRRIGVAAGPVSGLAIRTRGLARRIERVEAMTWVLVLRRSPRHELRSLIFATQRSSPTYRRHSLGPLAVPRSGSLARRWRRGRTQGRTRTGRLNPAPCAIVPARSPLSLSPPGSPPAA